MNITAGNPTIAAMPTEQRRRFTRQSRLMLLILAVLLLLGIWALRSTRPDPLEARLVGAWELRSTPSVRTERRTIEFQSDGKFWIYRRGKRNVKRDTYHWHVSEGDLVVIFDDPLQLSTSTSAGRRIKELARRIGDPSNVARSYRYSINDGGGSKITIRLIEELGNPPAQMGGAILTREPAQPPVGQSVRSR
jgi:hypothetical protein